MSILSNNQGEYVVVNQGESTTTTYTNYNDIPANVDAVVKFVPDIPESPHTVNEHADMQAAQEVFEALGEDVVIKPATRIGDLDYPHCSPMVRAVGSPNVFVNGIPWSLQGHINTPHLLYAGLGCDIHVAPIAVGSPTVRVNGVGAGRVFDAIAGCTFVAEGSPNVFCGP